MKSGVEKSGVVFKVLHWRDRTTSTWENLLAQRTKETHLSTMIETSWIKKIDGLRLL